MTIHRRVTVNKTVSYDRKKRGVGLRGSGHSGESGESGDSSGESVGWSDSGLFAVIIQGGRSQNNTVMRFKEGWVQRWRAAQAFILSTGRLESPQPFNASVRLSVCHN